MIKVSVNGQIFKCKHCNNIHLEYMNLGIDFDSLGILSEFMVYLDSINTQYYETKNRHNKYRRKIMIPLPKTNIKMMLNSSEVAELRRLLGSYLWEVRKTEKINYKGLLHYSTDFPEVNLN